MKTYVLVFLMTIVRIGAKLTNCPKSDIVFEKVLGFRPSDSNHPLLLFQRNDDSAKPLTDECITKCQQKDDCRSFVLYFNQTACYWYKSSTEGAQELQNVADSNVAWFIKTCLTGACKKLWSFERIPGATLIGNDTKTLPQLLSRTDCQQYCLNETEFQCRSVKFKVTESNYGPNPVIRGSCVLSDSDRHLLPNSYRVSSYDEEYFENQCVQKSNNTIDEFCAYEEYTNASLAHKDILYDNKTKQECQDLCDGLVDFLCRGFSLIRTSVNSRNFSCYLHSEDSKVHGPKLLVESANATYYEKARCLNISVVCTETYMTVLYNPEIRFNGRLYMEGYSDHPECFSAGRGTQELIVLKLPVLSKQCGITQANGSNNRTLVSGTMILQYNSLIQTQGDRIIRVGCIFGNESKVVIGTGVTISSGAPNKGSTIVETKTNQSSSPVVEMKVLDLNSHEEVSDTQIGQELELIIEAKVNGSLDIWASHLIAMTENSEDSIFLLDDRGCPPNLNIFPALEKTYSANIRRLSASFQAFKFASSPVVRFSVIIQFCPEECPPVDCGNNILSYGRRKRQVQEHVLETINGTAIVKMTTPKGRTIVNEMPLEYIMVVRGPNSATDRLVVGEKTKILVAGYDYVNNEVCLDYSLTIGLIAAWAIVQVIFIVCCLLLVRKYRKYYEHEYNRQSLEELNKNFGLGFSNLDNRRVHWADNETFS